MIELAWIKPDQLEALAMMVAVTRNTLFAAYFGGIMITSPRREPLTDFSMAFKTFRIGNFIAKNMTLCAI